MRYTELLLSFPPRYSLLDSFLPDAGVNFDLVILKTEALGLRLIAEFLDFCYYCPIVFTKYCGIFYPHYPIVHRDLCRESPSELLFKRFCWSKRLSLKYFLLAKPQKLPPFSLKFTHTFLWRWLFAWLFSLNTGPSPLFPADSPNTLLLLPLSAIALIVFPKYLGLSVGLFALSHLLLAPNFSLFPNTPLKNSFIFLGLSICEGTRLSTSILSSGPYHLQI